MRLRTVVVMRGGRSAGQFAVVVAVLSVCACSTTPIARGSGVAAVGSVVGMDEVASLKALARIFYSRVSNRRFNSIAAYQDPALREFFRSPEAFADYFADFVDDLTEARFRAERPTNAELEGIEADGPARFKITVRFEGDNALPLRWWKVDMVREDLWERVDGRWWIIPGKL